MTADVFEVVFHVWMVSITILCNNTLVTGKTAMPKRGANEQDHYVVYSDSEKNS